MRVDVEQATARDPLRPTLLHLLRMTMTPDTPAIVDEETDAFEKLLRALTPEQHGRLMTIGLALLADAGPHQLGALNVNARALGLPIRVVYAR